MAESTRCLQCTCEAIGFCDLRRLGIEYGTTLKTLEPQNNRGAGYRSVTENRFTGYNHDYIRDDSHAFILREPSRCIDCGRCAQVCSEVVGAACYDFMRIGFDTLVTTPLDMSLNDTPCVSCGRCAETCPTGALMPKPRILEKYEVDESRCILCGICVDACPYDALRCGPDFELAHTSREEPMIDLIAIAAVDRETEMTYIRRERDWAERAVASGRDIGPADAARPPASLAASGRVGMAARRAAEQAARATATGTASRQAGQRQQWARDRRDVRRSGPRSVVARAVGGPAGRGDNGGERDRCRYRIPCRSWGSAGTTCCSSSWPAILLGSALLVVTLRDIIRCGLAMIVAFGALAGIYVMLGAPLVAAAQVLVYIGAIAVLILFAVMLTQAKNAPVRLVFQTQAIPAAIAAIVLAVVVAPFRHGHRLGRGGHAAHDRDPGPGAPPVQPVRPPARDRERAAAGGGRRRRLPGPARGSRRMSQSLDAYLVLSGILFAIGTFGFLARRNAISMLMSIELMLNAVNLTIVAFGAFVPALNVSASVIALMVMAVAAAEATVGLAIVMAIYRNRRTPLVDEYDAMRQ